MASPPDPSAMETVAEVRLSHDRFVLGSTIATHRDLTIQLTAQAPTSEGDWLLFLTATGDGAGRLAEALDDDPTVADPRRLTETEDHCVYRVRTVAGLRVAGVLGDLGFRVLDVTSDDGDWCYRIQGPDRSALTAFFEHCQSVGIDLDLERIYRVPGADGPAPRSLTDGQTEALRLANEGGYFAVPREMTLGDLADELDISRQAASERLRRAVGSLLEETF
ncbi:helix-turn-helix domain-containing protein [Haloarchaeobius iranensis]|uniref:Predicted DNA binding protein, contains HTH domain n=1 Tax=Haloarchaeobius iranensis TaxID=996166 RepID=A0A1H0AIE1_9EURY|nr:bacterio-opsin activator domain-containing protein [Haloarchaeobius iranensis]SDN33378.1 Predicted DNA binding protein, contains HTH domain [Haloarchaeobius iranensis]